MKKYILLLVILGFVLTAYSQVNLITNLDGDFYQSKTPVMKFKVIDPIQEIVFDQIVQVAAGQKLTYKAWAKSLSGPFMLRIHCTYFDDSNALKADVADQTWLLSDVYTEHIYVLPTVPVGATFINIGFRAYRSDGRRFPITTVTCLIDDVQLYKEVSTSIKSIAANNKIQIYPNPATDRLSVVSDKQIKNISIYNLAGQKLIETFNNFNTVNISDLHSGIYFVKMITEGGESTQKLIVK